MSEPIKIRHMRFITHRCEKMPEGFSLRKHKPIEKDFQWPDPDGWVLGHTIIDEYCYEYLESITPRADEHVRFCPWCGEELEVDE